MNMMSLLLLLCVTAAAALPLAAFSRSQNLNSDWSSSPSDEAAEDLKMLYDLTRPSRHADGLFTSSYSKLLGQLSAKDYLDTLMAKRVNGDLMDAEFPVKRHSDAVFTDNYSRLRKQMAVKKYLNSVLGGRRSVDEPGRTELSIRADSASQQTGSDVSLEDVLNHLTL